MFIEKNATDIVDMVVDLNFCPHLGVTLDCHTSKV